MKLYLDYIIRSILLVILMFVIFGSKNPKDEPIVTENTYLEPYIKNLILADTKPPYLGNFYIHVDLKNLGSSKMSEITFTEINQKMSRIHGSSSSVLEMALQGVSFIDSATFEELRIALYFNVIYDTVFNICYANYIFADPWKNVAGANVEYFKPVTLSDPSSQFMFLGTNSAKHYFEIRYIGNNRLNGVFHTIWHECCGVSTTYDVYGDFSIPDIRQFYK